MITLPICTTDTPLYKQIYEWVKAEIQAKNYRPHDKLPSKRKLSEHLCVSINTIDAAYSQLMDEGYIMAVPKKGYFVCEIDEYHNISIVEHDTTQRAQEGKSKVVVDFSPSDIDHTSFPYKIWRNLFKSCFDEADSSILKRTVSQGDMNLRKELVTFLHSSRGVNCDEKQIVIGAGTENSLRTLSLVLSKNTSIALENPVYRKAYQTFSHMGRKILPIPIDDKGIEVEPLQGLSHVAVYVTPSHQFPLGISMPIGRRVELLNFANRAEGRYIIEDDYDSEFRYIRKPIPSLQSIDKNGKVIYIGTFSTSIAPSIRISYMVLPINLLNDYYKIYSEFGSEVSILEQRLVAEFIAEGYYEKHLNKMRKLYKDKRGHLLKELAVFGDNIKVIGESAGNHILIKLLTLNNENDMCQAAAKNGVRVYPISNYLIGPRLEKYQNTFLLGYAALSKEEISKGVHLLGTAWNLAVSSI
ncbi:transcriptional regulator with HTH domain and aminotransferase domain [Desulfosporosinus orientis DSM 765]|uniref:Transcriptional regulator with HTH domain and aminotransferase domain n=1 Tax=Desulfosporosinus orientis (strain ATCC 19365 / DSM 765 / NCIMB 8382 / VKM B-1628 / Singapore I) TaxID=768706 RepID=G7W9N6_DESOD|nr:PLP-dependent aminotransferase family protein [Desulfosporosinus orientis]AET69953.1 transcriptional regulator with HTH domain and aminotransferase domain [Desulfosporosinus orientis DSM 765]